jgi:hypothetical protein
VTEQYRAAIHEAGHGIVAIVLGVPFDSIVVYEDAGRWGGGIEYEAIDDQPDAARGWAETFDSQSALTSDDCAVIAAGVVAECLVCQTFSWHDVIGVSGDLASFETHLRATYADGHARRLAMRAAFQQAEDALTCARPALEAVAAQLLELRRLTYDEVRQIVWADAARTRTDPINPVVG